jgi:ComF family protein
LASSAPRARIKSWKASAFDSFEWKWRDYHLFWAAVDLVFPPSCVGCGQFGQRWCGSCLGSVERITDPICSTYCRPGSYPDKCRPCVENPPLYDAHRSWAVYAGAVREAVIRLKYKRDMALGETMGLQMALLLRRQGWQPDLVVPVPLGRARQRSRGYNQAASIARPLALELRLPLDTGALARVRETSSQVRLTALERVENVRGAFAGKTSSVSGRSVLLVDDVSTTGATLLACAAALREAGAREVFCLTAARASAHEPPGDV